MTSLILTLGSWTIDEPSAQPPTQGQQETEAPAQSNESWLALLDAMLDALIPYQEAYEAAIAVIAQAHGRLTQAPPIYSST